MTEPPSSEFTPGIKFYTGSIIDSTCPLHKQRGIISISSRSFCPDHWLASSGSTQISLCACCVFLSCPSRFLMVSLAVFNSALVPKLCSSSDQSLPNDEQSWLSCFRSLSC